MMRKCFVCEGWISLDEGISHTCLNESPIYMQQLGYISAIFQSLQGLEIGLPFGDYEIVYDILEDLRDTIEIASMTVTDIRGKLWGGV